jgi:type II secretory pathway component PulC
LRESTLHFLLVAANLAVAAAVLYVAADVALLTWQHRGEPDRETIAGPEPEETGRPSLLAARKPLGQFNSLSQVNVFRTGPPRGRPKPEASPPPIQETLLDLQLKGTVIGENVPSFAVIVNGDTRKEEVYRENETIQGVRIEGITRDSVILEGTKGKELLGLEESDSPKAGKRPPARGRGKPRVPRKKKQP